jgi:hypothetical protein
VNVNDDLKLELEGFSWGSGAYFGNTYMKKRANYTYYKSVLRLAEQYAPNAKSVIDVGAPWPYVTAFSCERRRPAPAPHLLAQLHLLSQGVPPVRRAGARAQLRAERSPRPAPPRPAPPRPPQGSPRRRCSTTGTPRA